MTQRSAPVGYNRGRLRADTRKLDAAQKTTETNVTSLEGDRDSLKVETWSWFIEFPDEKNYKVIVNAPYAVTVNSITTISTTGTCTLTGKINTTALGGTANSVSTSEQTQTHASANSLTSGDDFVLTVSSNSSCENMSVTVKVTRTL